MIDGSMWCWATRLVRLLSSWFETLLIRESWYRSQSRVSNQASFSISSVISDPIATLRED